MKKYLLFTAIILSIALSMTGCGNSEETNKDINVTSISESQENDISKTQPQDEFTPPDGEKPQGDPKNAPDNKDGSN